LIERSARCIVRNSSISCCTSEGRVTSFTKMVTSTSSASASSVSRRALSLGASMPGRSISTTPGIAPAHGDLTVTSFTARTPGVGPVAVAVSLRAMYGPDLLRELVEALARQRLRRLPSRP
jgi:hypothetical protein